MKRSVLVVLLIFSGCLNVQEKHNLSRPTFYHNGLAGQSITSSVATLQTRANPRLYCESR